MQKVLKGGHTPGQIQVHTGLRGEHTQEQWDDDEGDTLFSFHILSSECSGIFNMPTMLQDQDTLYAPEQPPTHSNQHFRTLLQKGIGQKLAKAAQI